MTLNISLNEHQPQLLQFKKTIFFIAFVLIAMVISSETYASGACKELPHAEDFACNTEVTFMVCSLQAKVSILKGSYDELRQCIDDNKKIVGEVYKSSKPQLAGNAEATEAMKELYSYWLSSMDLLIPGIDERKFQYENKIQEREVGIKDRANRLKIESL